MRLALLLSVAIHALLLSIPIDGDVFGLPGLRMPWEERRLTASDLQVVLAPLPVATPVIVPAPVVPPAAPAPQTPAEVEKRVVVSRAPAPAEPAPSLPAPAPAPKVAEAPVVTPDPSPAPQAEDARRAQLEDEAGARIIALENARREQAFQVEQQREAARIAAARLDQGRLAQLAAAEQQRQADLVAQAQAQAQAREQAAREDLARTEAARVEAERQAQARLAQQEAARQEAARQEAMRQEAARQAQQAQQAQAQQAQAQQAPARPALSAQEAQREERLRAIGRQLNQEAAQRDAANGPPGTPLPQVSGQRRGWLVGRADPNTELITYAQAMGRKIELNMTIDTVRDAARQPHRQPVVTVAVRSDGSVERVTFMTSSGVPAIDEAIRKIVASQAPFGPFPPALARQYDVVEIRRTWIFDVAVRLE
jgi:TolA protein